MASNVLRTVLIACLMPAAVHGQSLRVLFLGNSYTGANNLPSLVEQLAASQGLGVQYQQVNPGGYTFQQHAVYGPTLNAIRQGNWDVVVLQEQSQLPSFPPAQVAIQVFPFAQALVDSIRAYNACAVPTFYMTWGRENGDAMNCANWPPVCTYDGMQAELRMNYLQMTLDHQAHCAAVGAAWKVVRDLHPGIDLYAPDGSHPSLAGSYLAACVMYCTFFRQPTSGASFVSTLDPTTAGVLQGVADQVVLDSTATWNLGVNDPQAVPLATLTSNGTVDFSNASTGATSHLWLFGDGSQSTDPAPTHTYGASGTFDVVYVASDACGRADSAFLQVQVITTGIRPNAWEQPVVRLAEGQLRILGPTPEAILEVMDPTGRLVLRRRLPAATEHLVPLPDRIGTIIWRLRSGDGYVLSGVSAGG